MSKVAIVPVFKIHADHYAAFIKRICQQRDDCLGTEPGCLHFDVLEAGDGETVMLYEVYTDEAALEAHRTYPHYADYKATTEPMVRSLDLVKYTVV
jgi:quinol monooxygenase YgiN